MENFVNSDGVNIFLWKASVIELFCMTRGRLSELDTSTSTFSFGLRPFPESILFKKWLELKYKIP